jgi:hypothetical protein
MSEVQTRHTLREAEAVYFQDAYGRALNLGGQAIGAIRVGDADRAYWLTRWALRMAAAAKDAGQA